MNVLLGVTGSVAAIRTPTLVADLTAAGHNVRVVTTRTAEYFFDPASVPNLVRDADEWPGERYRRGDPVLHIELRRWADVLLVAPCDANTLAKMANGLADNCLTCVWRAWDVGRPALLAPAMNTLMWQHPLTRRQLVWLAELVGLNGQHWTTSEDAIQAINSVRGFLRIIPPIAKELACGDVGMGAMAEVSAIVAVVSELSG